MNVKKHILTLSIIYMAAHILLCFISGIWWDDWGIWMSDFDSIKQSFWEAGVPWEAYNLFSVMWIPDCGYRIVVFFLFLASGLLFYGIMCGINCFSREDAFWISAVAMTVPVNDARATLICYGYSLSLCLFMISFYMVTKLCKMEGRRKLAIRIISLLLLLYSYTTESLLVFTGLIWLYLFYLVRMQDKDKKLLQKIILFLRTYWDYFLLPFAFFIIKNIFFKPYGNYEGYNSVTLGSFMIGIIFSPIASLMTGVNIRYQYIKQIGIVSVIVLFAVVACYIFYSKKNCGGAGRQKTLELERYIWMLLLGCIVYYAGAFAYIVVRKGNMYGATGVGGRDAMLLGFGIGMMEYSFAKLLPVRKAVQNMLPIIMVVLGIFHFNDWYLNYQEDWYHQQEFAKAIKDNQNFYEADTLLCDFAVPSPNGGRRFYSLNGMYHMVTGKMDKFFFSGIGDLQYGMDFNEEFLNGYNCDDYDSSDMVIDGILFVNNSPIDNKVLMKMRLDEIFNREAYENAITSLTDAEYIKIEKAVSDKIYDSFRNGELTSDLLRKMVTDQ